MQARYAIYRQTATGWEKILDEPSQSVIPNTTGRDYDKFKLVVHAQGRQEVR